MARARRWTLSVTLAGLVGLIVLSIVGAFLGARRAGALFNSAPMMVFWVLLGWLFVAWPVFWPRLATRPGLLSAHLGCLLVLAGGMAGSRAWHVIAGGGRANRPYEGVMVLNEGQYGAAVHELPDAGDVRAAHLPFRVLLERAWVEHYEPASLALGRSDGRDWQWQRVDWRIGRSAELGDAGVTARVLTYLPSARVVLGPGVLRITGADGRCRTIPAEPASQLTLEQPGVTVRVERVFERLSPEDLDLPGQPVEPPDSPSEPSSPRRPLNPVVELSFRTPDGRQTRTLVFHRAGLHGGLPPGVEVAYEFPDPPMAQADPDTHAPAMEIELRREGRVLRRWLAGDPDWPLTSVSLAPLVGDLAGHPPVLALAEPEGPVKDYFCRLAIIGRDGRVAVRKTVEVNRPLQYGGYHFHLNDYDASTGRLVLGVRRDRGLWLVRAGLVLLAGGALWQCGIAPLVKRDA